MVRLRYRAKRITFNRIYNHGVSMKRVGFISDTVLLKTVYEGRAKCV